MLQGTNLATEDDPEPPGSGGQAYTVYEQVIGIFNKEKALEGYRTLCQPNRPALMIIASRTQFYIETLWGQSPFSIVS